MHDSPPCRPRRPQGRGVHRFVRVLLADRGDLEARVFERGTDVRIRVEVLPVLLAEGLAVTGPRDLDRGVAGARGGSTTLVITKSFPADSARDDGVGDGEAHHRVGVEVEDEPTGGPEAAGDRVHRQPQVVRSRGS